MAPLTATENMLYIVGFFTLASLSHSLHLKCGDGYELKTIVGESQFHIGEGTFLVSVCCPNTHLNAIYFGREGVGCCQVEGQRCVLRCQCKNSKKPMQSNDPIRKCSDGRIHIKDGDCDLNTASSKVSNESVAENSPQLNRRNRRSHPLGDTEYYMEGNTRVKLVPVFQSEYLMVLIATVEDKLWADALTTSLRNSFKRSYLKFMKKQRNK